VIVRQVEADAEPADVISDCVPAIRQRIDANPNSLEQPFVVSVESDPVYLG